MSVHAGAPVMANFVEEAREILDSGSLNATDSERFRAVIDYRNRHDLAEQKAGLDFTNIEHLFGLVDVNTRLEPDTATLREHLIFLILKTLECKIRSPEPQEVVISAGGRFHQGYRKNTPVRHFVDLVARRWEPKPNDRRAKDVIISLNYDLVVEDAMEDNEIQLVYSLGHETEAEKGHAGLLNLRLLKLHGSANWGVCSKCDRVAVFPPRENDVSKLASRKCESCGKANLQPLIVPPTWNKGQHNESLEHVWRVAFKELVTARRLVLIGTSLPETDRFLYYYFALALQRNVELDRILIVNPINVSYGRLFEVLPKRVELRRVSMTFEEYVATGNLQHALGSATGEAAPVW